VGSLEHPTVPSSPARIDDRQAHSPLLLSFFGSAPPATPPGRRGAHPRERFGESRTALPLRLLSCEVTPVKWIKHTTDGAYIVRRTAEGWTVETVNHKGRNLFGPRLVSQEVALAVIRCTSAMGR